MKTFTTVTLKNGIMIVPSDYIPIEETRTEDSDYAGVIREIQGTIPHYIVFFYKPFAHYTFEEQKEILEKCAELRPEIGKALNAEVEMVLDDDGIIKNPDEYRASVRVAIDPIPERDAYEALVNSLGIIRRE